MLKNVSSLLFMRKVTRIMFSIKRLFNLGIDSRKVAKKSFRKIMHNFSLEERFTKIYEINYWGKWESKSGKGSTLSSTERLRKELPNLFKQFGIKTVFDGPCGDFNWMRHVISEADIFYIGGDIVEPMIASNQANYGNHKISFIKLDLTKNVLPNADLMICRDCLFHLSFQDTLMLLQNFDNSNIPWLLTTTYKKTNEFVNVDINTGHFRRIDLCSAPYHFPEEIYYKIEDYMPEEDVRYMCLWSKQQVQAAILLMQQDIELSKK